jgi:ABC-type multidrug transport system ATPase subunit
VSELLKNFKLKYCEDKKASKLSGGEKRKLMMAIACCGGSEIIILDEPTGGVDIQGKNEIWEILNEMKQERVIILITHDMNEAWELADRIGILKDGKFKFIGIKDDLIDKYEKYIKIQINKKINKKLRGLPGAIEKKFLIRSERSNSGTNNMISETHSDTGNLIGNTESFTSNSTVNLEKVEFIEYNERALIKIPIAYFNFKKLDELLNLIEEEYGVKNYSIDSESLDDLFINVVETKKDYDKKNIFRSLMIIIITIIMILFLNSKMN